MTFVKRARWKVKYRNEIPLVMLVIENQAPAIDFEVQSRNEKRESKAIRDGNLPGRSNRPICTICTVAVKIHFITGNSRAFVGVPVKNRELFRTFVPIKLCDVANNRESCL